MSRRAILSFGAVAVAAVCAGAPQVGQRPVDAAEAQRPLKHPTVVDAAALSGARAESIYQAIRLQLRNEYMRSGDPTFVAYQSWKRFNRRPYRSPSHGKRFVNHYANDKAAGYGKYENLDPMPAGAIVIKDSFVVTKSGGVMTGPLFMMEKMGEGFDSIAGTWRFLMLRPDGSLLGMTGGAGAENVRFCAECHRDAGAGHDYLYFMPRAVRVRD